MSEEVPQPKNGRYLCLLLAGGPADVAAEIRDRLAERRGVLVVEHREYHRKGISKPVNDRIDLVVILKDMIDHPSEGALVKQCKRQDIPFVRTQRKWTIMDQALRKRGLTAEGGMMPEELMVRNPLAHEPEEEEHYPSTPQVSPPVAAEVVHHTPIVPGLMPTAEPPLAEEEMLSLLRRWTAEMLANIQVHLPEGVSVAVDMSRHQFSIAWKLRE